MPTTCTGSPCSSHFPHLVLSSPLLCSVKENRFFANPRDTLRSHSWSFLIFTIDTSPPSFLLQQSLSPSCNNPFQWSLSLLMSRVCLFLFIYYYFWLRQCGFPNQGSNHWTTREFPESYFYLTLSSGWLENPLPKRIQAFLLVNKIKCSGISILSFYKI